MVLIDQKRGKILILRAYRIGNNLLPSHFEKVGNSAQVGHFTGDSIPFSDILPAQKMALH